ncbi:MAG: hypothetical protein K5870_10860 [Lachnospiraceae bacterium]|nr:hypothetical protein [Lachnospiraceae bacterium]
MLNLLKYEFRKTLGVKAIILVLTAVLEIVFLIGLYGEFDAPLGIGAGLLFTTASVGVIVIGIYSIILLRNDLNTKQSYMLFMTPNNSYKILGAKVIECGLSIFIIGMFFTALGFLDLMLVSQKFGEIEEFFEVIKLMFSEIADFSASTLFSTALSVMTSWLFSVVTAFFAVVLSATFLNGKKFNGLISLVIFIAISLLVGYIFNKLPFDNDIYDMKMALITAGFYIIPTVLMYFVTAWIMDNKLSV